MPFVVLHALSQSLNIIREGLGFSCPSTSQHLASLSNHFQLKFKLFKLGKVLVLLLRVLHLDHIKFRFVLYRTFSQSLRELLRLLSIKGFRVVAFGFLLLQNDVKLLLECFIFDLGQGYLIFEGVFGLINRIFVIKVICGDLVVELLHLLKSFQQIIFLVSKVLLFQIKFLRAHRSVLLIAGNRIFEQRFLIGQELNKLLGFCAQSVDILMRKNNSFDNSTSGLRFDWRYGSIASWGSQGTSFFFGCSCRRFRSLITFCAW